MSTFRTDIAGVSVAELARQFGTPTFVYDASMIHRRIADLAAFDVVRYAQKACSNLAILDLIRRSGTLVDAVSAGEIRRALAAGYSTAGDPPPIVYTADLFDAAALDLCVEQGVHVNCGSPDMIDQLGGRAPGRDITLRVNPGFGHGHSQKTNTGGKQSKHGIWHAEIAECLDRAARHRLSVTGLHMHIGSGVDLEHLGQVCEAMERVAGEVGPSLRSISAGGGLPTIYRPTDSYVDLAAYFALWDATRERLARRFGHALRLEVEPGRYLVAESGFLVAEIRAVKRQDDNTFYLVDAGFNNLARPILYGSYHPMSIVPRSVGQTFLSAHGRQECPPHLSIADKGGPEKWGLAPLAPANGACPPFSPERPEREVIVGGPLCESGDIFTQEEGGFVAPRRLPEAGVGDLLVIECAGAYGFVMGSNYNSQPLAAEVLIDAGRPRLIRRRQTFEDLIRGEEMPIKSV